MKGVPPPLKGVTKTIQQLHETLQLALTNINRTAGQRMSRGDYSGAEILASQGKRIRQFQVEVKDLLARWRREVLSDHATSYGAHTPEWKYYQPILKTIVLLGGECHREAMEPQVKQLMADELLPGDLKPMSRNRERWQIMIRRSRKALVAEGWLEPKSGATWRITQRGREVSEKPTFNADLVPM